MEVGEMGRKEPQTEIPWIPTTPMKPILPKSVPICPPVEGNNQTHHHANGAVACSEFSNGSEKNKESHHGSVSVATIADIAGYNSKICEKTGSHNVSCWSDLDGSAKFLFPPEGASSNSYSKQLGNNNGLNDLFGPSVIETSDNACCSKRTSQGDAAKMLDKDEPSPNKELSDLVVEFTAVSSPLKENHNPDEGSSLCTGLTKTPEKKPRRKKHRPKVIREGKPKRTPKPATPKPAQSKGNTIGKRKYVRRKELNKTPTPATEMTGELTEKIPEAAEMSCRRSINFEIGAKDESSAGRGNTTALLDKENGVAVQETNVGLACDLNTPVKHASNSSMLLPEDTQVPDTSSQNTHPEAKPKETGTALQEVEVGLAYDMKAFTKQAAENNYLSICNNEHTPIVHPCKETGAELQDIDVALAYDIEPLMKQAAENNCKSFCNVEQTLSMSPSKTNSTEENSKGNLTGNKYQRRKRLNKSTSQTEMTGGLTETFMPESKETTISRFSMGAEDESSAHRQIVNVQMDDVVEETPVGLAYKDTWMKQALHSYMALPEDPNGERKCVRKKRSDRTFTPKKMAGELTKPIISEPAIISCRMSINFDTGGRDESSVCNESLTNDQNTLVKEIVHHYTSLSENTQAPSTCVPKRNLLEVKQNARNKNKRKGLAEAEDGNISNAQASTVKLQIVRCEREHSETTERADNGQASTVNLQMEMVGFEGEHSGTNEHADNSSMNLIGAHYNRLHSYQSKFPLQFPSTCLPKCNPPGRKRNARNKNKRKGLAEVEDGNVSNGQASTVNLQMVGCEREHSGITERADNGVASTVKLLMKMVGCEREHSGTTERADNSSVNLVGCEREYSGTTERADNSRVNLIGAHSNGLHSYQSKFPLQFPNIQKKRRTEKGKTSNTHITSSVITKNGVPLIFAPEDAHVHPYASKYSSWMYGLGYNAAVRPIINESRENYIQNTQTFDEFKLCLRRMAEISQLPNQTCDYNSLMRIRNCIERNYNAKQLDFSDWQLIQEAERPQTCVDVLAVSCAKKKRNRKRSDLSSSMRPNKDEMQQCHNSALGNHQLTLGKPSGTARRVMRKIMHNVEALTEQFRQLNINTGAKELALYGQSALVPFQGSFDPIKKQRPRPKVDLDEETDRVWKLLLLDINHDGVDGTDEDKAKWWEGERNVFRGRAESFIARMHLVQGDRRFSRWKGSVVDSVVGVFLTQNVTDHLSSSAFMSLAARFPKKSGSMCGEGTSLTVNKQQVCVVEPEENTKCDVNLLNESVCNQSSMTVDIIEHFEEKTVNSNDSCRITSSPIILTDESNFKRTESPQRNSTECHGSMVVIEDREEKSCHDGTGKELNDIISSQSSVISSQISGDFSNNQNPEKIGSCSDSNSEVEDLSSTAKYNTCGSFSKLLEMVSSTKFSEVNSQRSKSIENMRDDNATESWKKSNDTHRNLGDREVNCSDPFNTEALSCGILKNRDENEMNTPSFQTDKSAGCVAVTHSQTIASQVHPQEQSNHMQQSFFDIAGQTLDLIQKERDLNFGDHKDVVRSETKEISSAPIKLKTKSQVKEEKEQIDWDSLRRKAQAKAGKREKTEDTVDSLDWDAVRCADVGDIANTIKERGMNNRLAERIQKFLKRLVDDHGSIDLEWLRDVPPDQAKEYLLSVRGLGLKSVECVRLLTLHHLAFPVDTNVGRIAVRLGWVPLQPLPESLQLHLLEMYPVLESIQKYLWPRLCKLDQKTLYELHYQMITFGKVFCTKSKPNCNACPMRAECRHFASAFASARLALPGPEQKSIVIAAGNSVPDENPPVVMSQLQLPLAGNTNQVEEIPETEVSGQLARSEVNICQPIIEEPTTPEPECLEQTLGDIEDAFYDDQCEIPTIKLNIEEFTMNLQNYMQQNMELQEGEMSKALVALNPEAASIPAPKLKNISRLRTEHCVYELPDTHPLLEGWDKREPDDPGKYLLAIWTPGETADSTQAPECKCSSRVEYGQLCNEKDCFSCNSFREANSQIVRGTLLIPCRTATRGSFPLNGTYFQVNEVFADHESSLNPVSVPRSWIWNLNRRTVYFGTSTTSIFKGLSTQEIQQAFWRGYICVRGFERKARTPRPLMARLHFPASKLAKTKEKPKKEPNPAKKSQVPKPAEKSQEPKPHPEQPELITNGHSLQEKGTA